MPIKRYSKTSPPIIGPKENTELAKYFDLPKFISLLKNETLFFCRLDKLEDKFERTLPEPTYNQIVRWWTKMRDSGKIKNLSDDEIHNKATEFLQNISRIRSLNCVNCWNEFDEESYALWKIYSDINYGIMINTSYSDLLEAFKTCDEIIYCSHVNYIDYKTDVVNFGNTMIPIIHKQKAYQYEKEVRLIHEVDNDQWVHDWGNEPFENGVMIPVDISKLINQVIISPFAKDWFTEIVDDILKKYSVNCKLSESKLK